MLKKTIKRSNAEEYRSKLISAVHQITKSHFDPRLAIERIDVHIPDIQLDETGETISAISLDATFEVGLYDKMVSSEAFKKRRDLERFRVYESAFYRSFSDLTKVEKQNNQKIKKSKNQKIKKSKNQKI